MQQQVIIASYEGLAQSNRSRIGSIERKYLFINIPLENNFNMSQDKINQDPDIAKIISKLQELGLVRNTDQSLAESVKGALKESKSLEALSSRDENAKSIKSTLYCSFCGKSQHEIERLVAGPTVFICNECIELCDDIVLEKAFPGRIILRVRIPTGNGFDDHLSEAIANLIEDKYPDLDLRYECRSLLSPEKGQLPVSLVFSYKTIYGNSDVAYRAYSKLNDELADAISKANVFKQKFLAESARASKLTEELTILKGEYLQFLRNQNRKNEEEDGLYAVLFLDVKGFSKFSELEKRRVLELIRGLVPTLLIANGAQAVNMWGDGIVAIFEEINQAIETGIRFMRHLSVERLDARIGMAWGSVNVRYNPALSRTDIGGATVDRAARHETMAQPGEILLSAEFAGHDIDENVGTIVRTRVKVTKAFAEHAVGDELEVFKLTILGN